MKKNSQELLDALLKSKLPVYTGDNSELKYERIPFGIEPLDKMLNGGLPKKRITLIRGHQNTGKSYLCSKAVASAQKAGGSALWVDAEISWDRKWMAECGVDVENVIVSQPNTAEEAMEIVRTAMKLSTDIVVIDSIAALVPSSLEKEDFDYNPMAWQARFINQAIARLMTYLRYGSAVVFINQLRAGVGPVKSNTAPGGMGQEFFAHLVLEVVRNGWINAEGGDGDDEKKKHVGFNMEIRSRKTKISSDAWEFVNVPFRKEGGIDHLEIVMREAIGKGIIKQAGPWYKLGDLRVQGLGGLKEYLLANPKAVEDIKGELDKHDSG